MKSILSVSSKLSLLLLLLAFCTNGSSQKAIIWKGGTPGMENEWNCPQNWSTSSVPDEFSNVFIPDVSTRSLSSPVLKSGIVEVNQLWLESKAMLTIENGAQLTINGHAEGIHEGNLHLNGLLLIVEETKGLIVKPTPQAKY